MGASLYNNNGQLSDPNYQVNGRYAEQMAGQTAPAGANPWSNGNTQSPGFAQQQAPGFAQQSPGGNSMQGMSPMGGNPYAQQQAAMPAQNLGMGATSPQAAPMQSASAPVPSASGQGDFGRNPWLQQQGQAIQAQSNQNLKQNVLPGIGQGAQAAGMYGSSRQGTAEGIAMGNAQTGVNSALANMYGQSYGQDQQYSLGQQNIASQAGIANAQMQNQFALGQMNNSTAMRGQDQSFNLGQGNLALGQQQANNSLNLGLGNLAVNNKQADNTFALGQGNLALGQQQANNSYDLGLRNNDLGFGQLDANINQQNFSNQLAGANFGLGIYDRMNGYNQQGTNNGTQMQNTPINQFNGFNNNVTALAGSGGNNVVAPQGNVLSTGLGAGLAAFGMMNNGTPDRNNTAVRDWLNAGRD